MPAEVREMCGVFGIFGHDKAAMLTKLGLFALQHRGQESAGITSSDGTRLYTHKGMGLVSEVFDGSTEATLIGESAIGHVRYSTTGSSNITNAQPLVVRYARGELAIAHNGNLVNAPTLRRSLEADGSIFQTTMDTEVVAHLIAKEGKLDFVSALQASLQRVRGAYALLFLSLRCLVAVRDPFGIRPLSLGKLGEAWVVASETCAFDAVGAEFVRDVLPGEAIVFGPTGMSAIQLLPRNPARLCSFEYIYFARPDSDLDGINVHSARKRMGRALARDYPVDADLVVGVPDSSISAASGFAEEAGIPYEMGLVKNKYVGRTFIQPEQRLRDASVRLKLNPLRRVVDGKRVVLVDDSIVRGTTMKRIVCLLREAGAREVHVRVSSPPYKYSCYYGIDTSSQSELVAALMSVEDIRRAVNADSLCYLSESALASSIGREPGQLCTACFSGGYPVPVADGEGKYALE
ncbi:MAG TPA: amidophosphoribosyltransferase [Firmicutes bacterium]|nr:amidophosphoribosyltransferase [Bacillota bacterium]